MKKKDLTCGKCVWSVTLLDDSPDSIYIGGDVDNAISCHEYKPPYLLVDARGVGCGKGVWKKRVKSALNKGNPRYRLVTLADAELDHDQYL